ncbi:MAG: MBL fold metallo-hydrolase [Gammaproteobacteria bacterium]|nr:MBL fold metallo-hydrolase [Gammaproteobacteria bacterium]
MLACATPLTDAEAQPGRAAREIVHVAGDVYRANNGNWWAIFAVTPEGIILGDPLNVPFATWLKSELDQRFDVPVRYVVYSHSHFDHAEGGEVFADTAVFVAHENMLRNMDGRYPQMPGDMVDRDNNGVIDLDDIMIPTNAKPGICGMSAGFHRGADIDGDGVVTPAELQRNIVPPDIVYSDRMQIELGGKRIELIHPGLNHADDATVIYFPDERIVFATEFLADALVVDDIRALPSACGPFDGSPLDEWIKSYRTVEAIDFDVLAGGHGRVLFDKSDVTATRIYFEDLKAAVEAAMAEGLSLAEMQQTIKLEQYADWVNYDRLLQDNIEAAYLNLKLYR